MIEVQEGAQVHYWILAKTHEKLEEIMEAE
jgi:hypothetical protein